MSKKPNIVWEKINHYLSNPEHSPESITQLCDEIGIDPTDRHEYQQVYAYFRMTQRRFRKDYEKYERLNMFRNLSPQERWNLACENYKANYGDLPFFFDSQRKEYLNPGFEEKQTISTTRLMNKVKAVATVAKEMDTYGETLEITGVAPKELCGDIKQLTEKIIDGKDFKNYNKGPQKEN